MENNSCLKGDLWLFNISQRWCCTIECPAHTGCSVSLEWLRVSLPSGSWSITRMKALIMAHSEFIFSSKPTSFHLTWVSYWRSLVGCHLWGHYESDTTERLPFHFSLSCVGEGNGNPLQCSCLENPRDGEAWWAAISGVPQSRTRLKPLSSSSSSSYLTFWKTSKMWTCTFGE